MKRQRGRGGRKPNGQANRHFESNGPDVKIRGSASHICEKYQQLARDAASAGDRVRAENYLQHAEHYFRVVQAAQPAQPNPRPGRERQDNDAEAATAAHGAPANGATEMNGAGEQPMILDEAGPLDLAPAPDTDALVDAEAEPTPPRRAPRTRRPRGRAAAAAAETAEAREALDAATDADTNA